MERDISAIGLVDIPRTPHFIKEENKLLVEIHNVHSRNKMKPVKKVQNSKHWSRRFVQENKIKVTKSSKKRRRRTQKSRNEEKILELLENTVIPLWRTPYAEQLRLKQEDVWNFIIMLKKAVGYRCVAAWPIKPSPLVDYLNQCVFAVGLNHFTSLPTVGFYLPCCPKGIEHVAAPDGFFIFPQAMQQIIKVFEAYIRRSDERVYNPRNHIGFWRQILVRTTQTDALLIIVVNPENFSKSMLERERNKLRLFFEVGEGRNSCATSIYFWASNNEELDELSFQHAKLFHILGNQCIEENILGLKLNISPKSHFSVNVSAAKEVIKFIAAVIDATDKTVVVDIDCGIGALSIHLAKQKGVQVIGIDEKTTAVTDAIINAYNNDVKTTDFLCGDKFSTLAPLLEEMSHDAQITIVACPLNSEIGIKILELIRNTEKVEKIIFVSSCGKPALNDLAFLCQAGGMASLPFQLIEVGSVDIQPNTLNLVLVFVLQRPRLRLSRK